jgi:hypothetical protein
MKPELRQWLIEKINDTGLLSGRVYSIQTINNVVEPFALISEMDKKVRRDSMDTFLDIRISVSVFRFGSQPRRGNYRSNQNQTSSYGRN